MPKNIRRKTIVNDPIHLVMDFGSDEKLREAIKQVVDTVSFQRLRRISQLGLASYVFPGATHSRFCHSLGAAYLAHRVVDHLADQEKCGLSDEINKNRIEITLAALLHDIGHGPFSHSFEHVLTDIEGLDDCPMHEDWTASIISSKNSDIYAALKENGLDPDLISSPFKSITKTKFPKYLKQIVSSQLDVDRMDYLVRDSHFAGVALGKIDVNYLINCLHVVKHGKSKSVSLGLTPKGVKSYESFVVARQLMNRSVYYHRKIKVLEYMVEAVFREIIKESSFLAEKKNLLGLIPDYLMALGAHLKKPKARKDNAKDFLSSNLASYIDLTEDSFWLLARRLSSMEFAKAGLKRAVTYSSMLLRRQVLESHSLQSGKDKIAEECLTKEARMRRKEDFDIVELKSTMYKKESGDDRVFVIGWAGEVNDVSYHSELISAFRDKPEVEKVLIVLDSSKNEKVERILRKVRAI